MVRVARSAAGADLRLRSIWEIAASVYAAFIRCQLVRLSMEMRAMSSRELSMMIKYNKHRFTMVQIWLLF